MLQLYVRSKKSLVLLVIVMFLGILYCVSGPDSLQLDLPQVARSYRGEREPNPAHIYSENITEYMIETFSAVTRKYEVEREPNLAYIYSENVTEYMIETFSAPLPQVLEDYRNPCWYEPIPKGYSYMDSYFYCCKKKHGLDYLEQQLKIKMSQGKNTRLRCFPSLFLLGFPKCGTGSLFELITTYMQGVVPALVKELQFWARRRFGIPRAGVRYADYIALFDRAANAIESYVVNDTGKEYHPGITLDFSPSNAWMYPGWKNVFGNEGLNEPKYILAHHLYHIWPDSKLVVIMRNPVKRAKSMFLHLNRWGKKDFQKTIQTEMSIYEGCVNETQSPRKCVYDLHQATASLTIGLYYIFIKDWLEVFPRDQFFFIRYEDLYGDDTQQIMSDFADFLGLKLRPKFASVTHTSHKTKADTHVRVEGETKMLEDFYAPWNDKLSALLGDEKWSKWNEEYKPDSQL